MGSQNNQANQDEGESDTTISLDEVTSDIRQRESEKNPWFLNPIHDSTIKTIILLGFFACALSSIVFGGAKYLMTGENQEGSEREAVGLITNVMSGITGIAAGVFTSGNLR